MSPTDDPVLAALRGAEEQYHSVTASLRSEVQAERWEAEKQHQKAAHLQEILQDIHRGLFTEDTYLLVLETCLKLTGATSGFYLAGDQAGGAPRIRASVGFSGLTAEGVSSFLVQLYARASQRSEVLVSNHTGDVADLPQPAGPADSFRNFIAAPVVLLRGLSGVIIAADKADGDFVDDDIQTLIHIGSQAGVAVENAELRRSLQNAYLATVSVLADAMEAKDPYTRGHCEMVSRYAQRIARRLDLPAREQSIVGYAALLHDIGKIGVSDGILNKPSALLPEERELVRSHVRIGHDLIRHVPALALVADAVLHHHEWYDGSGYPDGLQGDQIPIASRIVCVVDSYGAMITRRSYKEAYGEDFARAELNRCAGSQFDPGIVEAFSHVLDNPPEHAENDANPTPLPDFLPPG